MKGECTRFYPIPQTDRSYAGLTYVPIGLPSSSADWNKKESDKWCRKNVPDWCTGRQIINANGHHCIKKTNNNVNDIMKSYINKDDGKQLYKIPSRQMKSDETYAREDLDNARSLRRNAPAAAFAYSPAEASNWDQQVQIFHNDFIKKNCINYFIVA
jgi:hypothetical protein